jgi:Ser/Thr protein kinase RdoA (MazF antagonist)
MHVFDWDQAQRGWFMWDVSVALYFPFMLAFAGKWIDGSDAPGKDQYERFADWIVQGYETVQGAPRVDRPRLHRMVLLRREFYSRFCRRALDELNADPEYEKRVGYVSLII